MSDVEDTIVAIASPTTPARRGVIRISGHETVAVLQRLGIQLPEKRSSFAIDTAVSTGEPLGSIPIGLMVWPTSRSYTGQPSAEIHTVGSLPLLNAIIDQITAAGARAARPGEYTMRAFLAGRLDLTQAEAVLGVIDAQHRSALDHALEQLAGNLSRPLEHLRSEMLDLLADVEAGLDFVDEDIEFVSDEALVKRLSEIRITLEETQRKMLQRGGIRSETIIALRGEPNAGKSQLLNRIVDREVAIVADVAGTTRDAVEVDAEILGHPIRFVDTAGIETHEGDSINAQISASSQQQAERSSSAAAIRLWCVDLSRADLATAIDVCRERAKEKRQSVIDIWVGTKSDLRFSANQPSDWIATSGVTGDGIKQLAEAIRDAIELSDCEETGSVIGTAARCRNTLASAIEAIQTAIRLTQDQAGHEFVASELRLATQCLGEVTGAVYTEDILDRVFGRFCIGK